MKKLLVVTLLVVSLLSLAGCKQEETWSFCVNSIYQDEFICPWDGAILRSQAGFRWVIADVSITNLTDSRQLIPDWFGRFSLIILATDGDLYSYPDSYFPESEYGVKRNEWVPSLMTTRGELYFLVPEEMLFEYAVSMGIIVEDGLFAEPSHAADPGAMVMQNDLTGGRGEAGL